MVCDATAPISSAKRLNQSGLGSPSLALITFLVAGVGFEPTTFGLRERSSGRENFGPIFDRPLEPIVQMLHQLSPQSQELVTSLVRQLAEREGVKVTLVAAPGLQTPAEGIPLWVAKLKQEGYSKRTIQMYMYLTSKYLERDPAPTKLGIQQYLAGRLERVSPALVSNERKALRSLFSFLHGEGLWPADPTTGIRRVRVSYAERRCPRTEDVLRLLSDRCYRHRDAEKYRMLVLLTATTGLRLSEVAGLRRDGIDLGKLELRVTGKGGKRRVVPLLPQAAEALGEYMGRHDGGSPFVFPGDTPEGHTCIHSVEKTFRRACGRLGIERITPHQLRHYFATEALRNGGKLEVVSRILGHASVGITGDLYRHVLTDELHETALRFAPLNGIGMLPVRQT